VKTLYWLIGIAIIVGLAWLAWGAYKTPTTMPQEKQTESPVTVIPIEHATLILTWGAQVALVDPTDASKLAQHPTPTLVLVTDMHGDHFSSSTLAALVGSSTSLVVPKAVADELPQELASRALVLDNGESASVDGLQITAVPMYNLPDSDNANFHTPGRGNGYILERDGYRVYIAGDTAGTPEMRALLNIDLAFVPMNLPYTMSVEEAADAVLAFKPKVVYPYHYRGPDGLSDVEKFKSLVEVGTKDTEIMLVNWYPAQ
jgi:L-ascorbate metabolism protein UlaG (beta-lactamase superfamily)